MKFTLPNWIDPELWAGFEEMRKAKRSPLTDYARKLIVAKLQRLELEGSKPKDVLEQSIMNGWAGVFAVRQETHNGIQPRFMGKSESNLRALEASLADQETPVHSRRIETGDRSSLDVHRVLEGTRRLPN